MTAWFDVASMRCRRTVTFDFRLVGFSPRRLNRMVDLDTFQTFGQPHWSSCRAGGGAMSGRLPGHQSCTFMSYCRCASLKLTPATCNSSNKDTLATSLKQWAKGEEWRGYVQGSTTLRALFPSLNLVMQASDFCFILLLLNTFPRYSCFSFSEVEKGLTGQEPTASGSNLPMKSTSTPNCRR